MIGNDIVDLQFAESTNWQRPRFLDKLFTQEEQYYIKTAQNPEQMVWQLWSAKETAYKIYTRLYPSRFYNPLAFKCDLDNNLWRVSFGDFSTNVSIQIEAHYIFSEGSLNSYKSISKIISLDNKNPTHQSSHVKLDLLYAMATALNVPVTQLELIKNNFGVPSVMYQSKKIPVSIAHHGDYGCFSFIC